MSPGEISSVVLGYSHLDDGAARVGVGKVSLFSNFMGGRPTVYRGEIYKTSSLYIICVNLRSLCAERAYLSICHICNHYIYVFAFVKRPCAVSGVSDSPISDLSQIAREKPDFG